MRIYRFEHVECPAGNNGHGTCVGAYDCWTISETETPQFGKGGEPPSDIDEYQRCAVTAEQFPRWWDWIDGWHHPDKPNGRARAKETPGWAVVEYEMTCDEAIPSWCCGGTDRECCEPIETWRIDNDQVVFDPEYAVRIGTVTVESLMSRALVAA